MISRLTRIKSLYFNESRFDEYYIRLLGSGESAQLASLRIIEFEKCSSTKLVVDISENNLLEDIFIK